MKAIDRDDNHPDFFSDIQRLSGGDPYVAEHMARYMHAIKHMPTRKQFAAKHIRVLEVGTSFIFPCILLDRFGFDDVEITHFDPSNAGKVTEMALPHDWKGRTILAHSVDAESDKLDRPDGHFDLIICFEVLEHLEVDPMFMVQEFNRLLKPGGLLYLSTPNSTSARNVLKILRGYAPHFHMKYSKKREYYRHNIEYAPHQLLSMMRAGGFNERKFWTADTFEDGVPEIITFLKNNKYDAQFRGDNMFYIGERKTALVERYPDEIYY
jgi:SAM-dependent methyltransferase